VADGRGETRGRVISSEMVVRRLDRRRRVTVMCPPYTHYEDLVPLHGDVLLVAEDVREPEKTSSIARRALWKHDNGTMGPFPHFLQTPVFHLIIGGLGRDLSGVGEDGPEGNDVEAKDFCARSWFAGF
jgi:hypothetical protein